MITFAEISSNRKIRNFVGVRRNWLYLIALILLLPALLINLGIHTFIDDEGIRALVALEMHLSGNYVTPTLHGEFYYKKPPLFNWILLAFFYVAGHFNEWIARLPTVFATLGFGATIFYFLRKHFDRKTAFLNAMLYITCGRVLFWDSMLALIDTTFSWVTFTVFMVVFHEFEKQRWRRLFLLTYLLTAAGFLLKGLPAVVFQGITLVAYFAYRREWKRLFSLSHILGGLLFLAIVGGYYLVYNQYNALSNVFETLVTESSKRTVVNYGIGDTILHFFTFPFEMVYHFLPWSLMILYFLRRDLLSVIRQNRFVEFCLLTFLANIIIYWTSPEVYPRYLLMLAPLIFAAYLYLHRLHAEANSWQFRLLDRLFFVTILLVTALSYTPLFLPFTQWHDSLTLKTLAVALPMTALAWLYRQWPGERLLVMVLVLIVFRIGFDIFVLPDRVRNDFGSVCRVSSQKVGRKYADREMYLYKDIDMQPTNSFYLTNTRGAIIPRRREGFDTTALYIIFPEDNRYEVAPYRKVDAFWVRHGKRYYHVGQLSEAR